MTFTHILVPVSGNPVDEEAIRLAVLIARQDKAKISAIHVIEVQRNLPLNAENAPQLERGEWILSQAERVAKSAKGSIETELLQARIAGAALVNEAIERHVDLIIVGVPYRKPLGEFVLGTTTNYLLQNAPCRVWLCRELPRDDSSAPARAP
ncbi:MAG: universal stress protein [candidate division KSB1 bacterium]|nr:universal stress protein [candidate division KSB1 bacterium]